MNKIKVMAAIPVTLYEDGNKTVLWAKESEVMKKVFSVEDTPFWRSKIKEGTIVVAPEKKTSPKIKEVKVAEKK